jgi:hypothetical protein
MVGFKLQRLGMIMEPEPGNPQEVEGVLNPAAARGPDGKLYLFPRLVAKGNYSRIGIARVRFNEAGDPAGVERLGIALEPEADYELQPGGGRVRGSADHVRGTAPALLDDLRGIFGPRPTDRFGGIGGPLPLEAPGAREPSAPIRASNSPTWTTKTPASSPSPFPIHPGTRNWPSSTGRFSPALVRRRPLSIPRPVSWIWSGKASGFPTARRLWTAVNHVASASLPPITGWPLPSRPGSGSKSAPALRPS